MVHSSTGLAFTGTVTVYITKDAGTQAIGSVDGGVCTLEGNGYYTYLPTADETNANHVAFTFVATGAVPVSVQMYPEANPQSGDAYGLLASLLGTNGLLDVNVRAFQGSESAVDRMLRLARGIVKIVVGAGSTTNLVVIESADPAMTTADQWKGKILCFEGDTASESLRAQPTNVVACSPSGDSLTVTALTHAPVAGDEATLS